MAEERTGTINGQLAESFAAHRGALLKIIARYLPPAMLKRFTPEDVLGEAWVQCARRVVYFTEHPDVPVFFKFRTVLLQTITDLARRNLGAQARDIHREINEGDLETPDASDAERGFDCFAASVTAPGSALAREERHALLRATLAALGEEDRRILTLRAFDGLSNQDTAAALGISVFAASRHYAAALERLRVKLLELSEFR